MAVNVVDSYCRRTLDYEPTRTRNWTNVYLFVDCPLRRAAMKSDDLKRWQTDALSRELRPTLDYLSRLRDRMEKQFPPHDRLFQIVCRAQAVMQELCMEIHYIACADKVGRKRTPE